MREVVQLPLLVGVQQTSIDAYKEVEPDLGRRQTQVLDCIRRYRNVTNSEIANMLRLSINQVTPRTHELRKAGRVFFAEKRRCTVTGKNVLAWSTCDD